MGAYADLNDITNRCTGGAGGNPETIVFVKDARVGAVAANATVVGRVTSLWQYTGSPSDGALPGVTPFNPDNTTSGGLKQTNASAFGGAQKYLNGVVATSLSAGTLILYDRLLCVSGYSGAMTLAQAVGGTLSRSTGGTNNQIWIEIYSALGTTGTTITASYTNDVPTSGRTSPATVIGSAGYNEAQRIINIPLQQGDRGVTAVASVTLAGTTGTVGNFGINIIDSLLYVPLGVAGMGAVRDLLMSTPGPVPIERNACLAWAWQSDTTTAPQIFGMAHFLEA